jgi:hypothetical protein
VYDYIIYIFLSEASEFSICLTSFNFFVSPTERFAVGCGEKAIWMDDRGSMPDRDRVLFSSPPYTNRLQWESGALYSGVKWLERESDHPHLVHRLRISGVIPPSPYRFMD